MSPLLAALLGGALGGIASGVILSLALVLFGRRIAEGLLQQQVTRLETRFRENVVDATLGRIASFLDQGERLGQIVKRVVEILQLLFRREAAEGAPPLDGAAAARQAFNDIAAIASKPAAR